MLTIDLHAKAVLPSQRVWRLFPGSGYPLPPEAIRRLLAEALGRPVDAGSIAAEDLNASNDE